jgi:hypothetical protein
MRPFEINRSSPKGETACPNLNRNLEVDQIQSLVNIVCAGGDDPKQHSEALLVLLDNICRVRGGLDTASVARRAAFIQSVDNGLIVAQCDLLSGEIL